LIDVRGCFFNGITLHLRRAFKIVERAVLNGIDFDGIVAPQKHVSAEPRCSKRFAYVGTEENRLDAFDIVHLDAHLILHRNQEFLE